MVITGKQALADYLGYSFSMIDTNFPTVAKRALARGIKIDREGKGPNTTYFITEVEPQEVDKNTFSTRTTKELMVKDLPGEIWIPIFCAPDYQISNFGRIKNPQGMLNLGSKPNYQGYTMVSIHNQNYRIHRLVLQSFDPQPNYEELTVDHINGIRSDNRLENLRWTTGEQNTFAMLANRADLNKELTRIIQKFGYEKTMELLRSL